MSMSSTESGRALATPGSAALLFVAGVAWTILVVIPMGRMDSAAVFVPAWVLMMTAMMLPGAAPTAALWSQTVRTGRGHRLMVFALGYLGAWALTAIPAYGIWLLLQHHAVMSALGARLAGVGILAAAGLFQLTSYKERFLELHRSPLAHFARYSERRRRWPDLGAGVDHGFYCIGSCWALMLLMFVFGTMSIPATLGITALIVVEKLTPRGVQIARLAGVAALIWAVVVLIHPAAAPGLAPMAAMSSM
jgi:predicted metal-binding membrane protein